MIVTFRGGFVADCRVVRRLLDLEAKGARFIPLAGGAFRVEPRYLLTDEDRTFFARHRDEARRGLEYLVQRRTGERMKNEREHHVE